jgi:outer membrane usher protein
MVGCNLSYTLPERKRSTTYQPPQSLELPCVASNDLVPLMMAGMPAKAVAASADAAKIAASTAPSASTSASSNPASMNASPATSVALAQASKPLAEAQPATRPERDIGGLRMSIKISALPTTTRTARSLDKSVSPDEKSAQPAAMPQAHGFKTNRQMAVLQPSLKISALSPTGRT